MLDATKIPASEQLAFEHIVHLLQQLGMHTENFYMALHLYDFCENELHSSFQQMISRATAGGQINTSALDMKALAERSAVFNGWQEIATRDGALSIYHFGCIIDGIRSSLRACPTLSAMVDHKLLRIAYKSLRSSFPNYEAIRHVVAHAAEFTRSIAERQRHSRKGPFSAAFGQAGIEIKGSPDRLTQFTGNSAGRSYFVTLDGEVYGYELSQASADRLTAIRTRVHASLAGAALPTA